MIKKSAKLEAKRRVATKIRLTDYEKLKAKAEQAGMSMSTYLRTLLLRELQEKEG